MPSEVSRAVEAILMVGQEPIDPHLLAQLLEVAPSIIDETCAALQREYEEEGRGFLIAKVAGGYRFQTHPDQAAYVERFALEGQSARLSSAALETLAIVAYKQPLSRAQVAAIRGVNVDGVMRTLQQRGYVEEVGKDSGPGQAVLFGTSTEFLERLGLDRIEDLPPIADLFPSAEIMEALENTLRAERPEATEAPEQPQLLPEGASEVPDDAPPTDEAPATDDAAPTPTPAPAPTPAPPADAEAFPEPIPPAWAIDPEPLPQDPTPEQPEARADDDAAEGDATSAP